MFEKYNDSDDVYIIAEVGQTAILQELAVLTAFKRK